MVNKDNFPAIFERLKPLFAKYAAGLTIIADTSDNYCVDAPKSEKHPKGIFVGAVKINKNYVSYHLMPVYMFPDMLENLSDRLKKRMQGKSCFNFTQLDEELVTELAQLTDKSFERVRQEQLLQKT